MSEIQKNNATEPDNQTLNDLALKGDLSGLNNEQKLAYYKQTCESLGLNPLTQPFQVLKLNGKEVLYAKRDATDQLRRIYGVSVLSQEVDNSFAGQGVYMVTVRVQNKHGRTDSSTGAVDITGLKGEKLANAAMKAETKAKRRATLSICGLGMLDEAETDTIPGAEERPVEVPGEPAKGSQGQDLETSEEQKQRSIEAFNWAMEQFKACEDVPEMRKAYKHVVDQARDMGLTNEDLNLLQTELKNLAQ